MPQTADREPTDRCCQGRHVRDEVISAGVALRGILGARDGVCFAVHDGRLVAVHSDPEDISEYEEK